MEGAQEQDRVLAERSTRAAALLAWSLAAASLALLLTAEMLSYLSRSASPASVDGTNWLSYAITRAFREMIAAYARVGALFAPPRPTTAVGWLLSAGGRATEFKRF